MAKARHQKARTDRGWKAAAPKTARQRRETLVRCGRKAFLDPSALKYPIMAKSGPCVIDCRGLRAAKARAGQMVSSARRAGRSAAKFKALEKKATALGRRVYCRWAP